MPPPLSWTCRAAVSLDKSWTHRSLPSETCRLDHHEVSHLRSCRSTTQRGGTWPSHLSISHSADEAPRTVKIGHRCGSTLDCCARSGRANTPRERERRKEREGGRERHTQIEREGGKQREREGSIEKEQRGRECELYAGLWQHLFCVHYWKIFQFQMRTLRKCVTQLNTLTSSQLGHAGTSSDCVQEPQDDVQQLTLQLRGMVKYCYPGLILAFGPLSRL